MRYYILKCDDGFDVVLPNGDIVPFLTDTTEEGWAEVVHDIRNGMYGRLDGGDYLRTHAENYNPEPSFVVEA